MRITTRKRRAAGAILASSALVVLAACGGSDSGSSGKAVDKLGKTEGKVSILAWPGYVEDGSNDPKVDWVSAFEDKTKCQVTSKTYGTSDEAFNLAKTGDYDVVVASGDLTARMSVASSIGSPTVRAIILVRNFSTNSSYTFSWTRTRSADVHTWPE